MTVTDDLRVAANFWPTLELAGGSMARMAEDTGIPRTTLKEWKQHLTAGDVWLFGGWRQPGDAVYLKPDGTTIEATEPPDPIMAEAGRLREQHQLRTSRILTQEAARTEIILDHLSESLQAFPAVKINPPVFEGGKRRSPMGLVVRAATSPSRTPRTSHRTWRGSGPGAGPRTTKCASSCGRSKRWSSWTTACPGTSSIRRT